MYWLLARKPIDVERLKELYLVEKLSLRKCATILGCDRHSLSRTLLENAIPKRTFGKRKQTIIQKDILKDAYQERELSVSECAREFGTSIGVITQSLAFHQIPVVPSAFLKAYKIPLSWLEENYVKNGLCLEECADYWGCTHHTIAHALKMHGIPQRHEQRIKITKEWLQEHYINQNKSLRACAFLAGCTKPMIQNRLKQYGLPIGKSGVPKVPRIGDANPNWKGGLKQHKYCYKFDEQLRESIREEFDRKCFLCGMPESGRKLDVHHCDYNKGQGCGQRWALIPLCNRCHAKTGHNRHYYFNLLANYWAMNESIHLGGMI